MSDFSDFRYALNSLLPTFLMTKKSQGGYLDWIERYTFFICLDTIKLSEADVKRQHYKITQFGGGGYIFFVGAKFSKIIEFALETF